MAELLTIKKTEIDSHTADPAMLSLLKSRDLGNVVNVNTAAAMLQSRATKRMNLALLKLSSVLPAILHPLKSLNMESAANSSHFLVSSFSNTISPSEFL